MITATRRTAALLAALCFVPAQALAQRGSLIGVVQEDSAATPVAGATIVIAELRRRATTTDSGLFTFTDLPAGRVTLIVRRLGYAPRDTQLSITGSVDSILVRLTSAAIALEGVEVSAAMRRQRKNIQSFYERVERGIGAYVTRSDILSRKPMSTTDMLRTIPGIRVVRGRGVDGVRFMTSAAMRRDCMPMVWLDGQRAPGMEVGEVPVSDVEGIELYNGPSTTPMQFSQGPAAPTCGVVVVWTRPPPPPPLK